MPKKSFASIWMQTMFLLFLFYLELGVLYYGFPITSLFANFSYFAMPFGIFIVFILAFLPWFIVSFIFTWLMKLLLVKVLRPASGFSCGLISGVIAAISLFILNLGKPDYPTSNLGSTHIIVVVIPILLIIFGATRIGLQLHQNYLVVRTDELAKETRDYLHDPKTPYLFMLYLYMVTGLLPTFLTFGLLGVGGTIYSFQLYKKNKIFAIDLAILAALAIFFVCYVTTYRRKPFFWSTPLH